MHTKSVHEGVKYQCSKCGHKSTEKRGLKRHIESVHEGISFECNLCTYKASYKASLTQHKDKYMRE